MCSFGRWAVGKKEQQQHKQLQETDSQQKNFGCGHNASDLHTNPIFVWSTNWYMLFCNPCPSSAIEDILFTRRKWKWNKLILMYNSLIKQVYNCYVHSKSTPWWFAMVAKKFWTIFWTLLVLHIDSNLQWKKNHNGTCSSYFILHIPRRHLKISSHFLRGQKPSIIYSLWFLYTIMKLLSFF